MVNFHKIGLSESDSQELNVVRIFQPIKHLPATHKQYYDSSSNVLSWSEY